MEKAVDNNGFVSLIRNTFSIEEKDIRTYSPLTLAYIGDAIYELVIRTMFVEKSDVQVNKLHHKTTSLVKASAQCELYKSISELLTDEETAVFKRGRNAKSYTTAKNATIGDYRMATGVEALFGYLYLLERYDRIMELMKHCTEEREAK